MSNIEVLSSLLGVSAFTAKKIIVLDGGKTIDY